MNKADQVRIAVQELRLVRSARMGPVYFHGETMRPFLGEGDLVIVEPVAWEDIRLGDVLTYRFEDKFPTRRVVAIDREGQTVILHGDSIPGRPDYTVKREDVLGRAVARERNGVRVDRHSREWRWATRRVLAAHRVARLASACSWRVRKLRSRIDPILRLP